MLFTSSCCTDLVGILVALVAIGIGYMKWTHSYWKRKGVQQLSPSILFGDVGPMMRSTKAFGVVFKDQYDAFKRQGLQYGGTYFMARKFFVPVDPDLVKHIMQVDFGHFVNHGTYVNEVADPLSGHLFALEDQKWKLLREKLTPTFTSGKMKMMFPTMVSCGTELGNIMDKTAKDKTSLDIKDILARFSTDIIASCAFGVESNCLKAPDSEFRRIGKMIFEPDFIDLIKGFIPFILPKNILDKTNMKLTKQPVEDFIMDLVKKTVTYREKNNVFRKDFMHLLIQLKNMGKVTDDEKITDGKIGEIGLTMNEVAAQAFVFFAAGFETSSTTMTFALYELALNLDVQKKAREEMRAVLAKHNNEVTYDAVMEMKYLDKVVNETLRKYPPVPGHFRKCNKDYKVPDSDLVIENDTMVVISALGIQNDHEYYPNPEKFDPERFSEEEKAKRPAYTWIPFGEGPRLCIGLRFGVMQSKVGLISILRNHQVSINRRTTVPIEFDTHSFILASKQDIYLDVEQYD